MVDVTKLVKPTIRVLNPCVHGGDVWRISEKYHIPLDQVMDFSVPLNPLGTPRKALLSIRQHLSLINNYPDPSHEWLLGAFSDYVGVKPQNVIVGSGSTELIYLFLEVFLNKENDVLIPIPVFNEYKKATLKVGGNPQFLKCNPAENFYLDFEKLEQAITKRTRVIFLCNPNSPTGNLYRKEDVLHVIKLASDNDVLVFLDEDFVEFVYDAQRFSLAEYVSRYNNLFVLRSLTKFFGLAGLRMGFGIASADVVDALKKAKMPWTVNTLAMFAAKAAVQDQGFIRRSRLLIARGKRQMLEMFEELPWLKVYPSETNFFLVEITKAGLTSTLIKEELEKKGILIRDCCDFDGLNNMFFRVSVNKPENNKKLFENLKAFR